MWTEFLNALLHPTEVNIQSQDYCGADDIAVFRLYSSSNNITMQGLLSYSDEEDETIHPSSAIANGSKVRLKPPTDATSLLPPPPSATVSSPAIPLPSKLKSHLPPNIIRRIPSSQPTSSSSNTPNEAQPCSPLRKDSRTSDQTHPESPDPVHLGHIGPGEGEEFETEEETLRRLVRPAPLKNGDGWDEAYGLAGGNASSAEKIDPILQAKVTQFLNLKAQGTHFNDSLMKSRAFRNPTIYKKLVEFVDVDERRGFRKSIWDWDQGESKEWSAEKIADLQKAYSQRPSQPRTNIPFTSSTSSSSAPSTSSSSRPYPISNISKNPPARGIVESGGKPYAFVGMDSLGGGIREPKRERDRLRDREKDRRDDKRSRWG
ncbi:Transcriptional regulator [Phaffia rhodozyma]|uniref:Transcriptional regulator n=1 Tax=Phaffia rhodozyma TaxID=264483 RepID=A0A0F7SU97_PHARH|nr:Transcriptional regulator [Phaffia rhodozyma]